MPLIQIPAPDLAPLGVGAPTLQLLEALGFSQDGKSVLVRATFTDDGDTAPGMLRYGVWAYDLQARQYGSSLNALLAPAGLTAADVDVPMAVAVGDAASGWIAARVTSRAAPGDVGLWSVWSATDGTSTSLLAPFVGTGVKVWVERLAASDDGRFVAVQTDSPLLAPENEPDANDSSDIYLLDRVTEAVHRVSWLGGSEVYRPVWLGDLRVSDGQVTVSFATPAAFSSKDKNESALTEEAQTDAYVWTSSFDGSGLIGPGSFQLVSRRPDGQASGGVSQEQRVQLTDAGTFFQSVSGDLVAGDDNEAADVFLDAGSGALQIMSTLNGASFSRLAGASDSGRYLALVQDASPNAPTPGLDQTLLYDRTTDTWTLASTPGSGVPADDLTFAAAISPSGAQLAFTSGANNLVGRAPQALVGDLFVSISSSFTSGAFASPLDENSGANQVVYTATADDSLDVSAGVTFSLKPGVGDEAKFSIDATTGVVTLLEDPDHETLDSYTFTVVASDGVNPTVEQVVSLSVNDLDEVSPTITSGATATALDENSGANQVVYTATADDSLDVSAGVTFSLKPGVGDEAKFSIDATTGVVTLLEDPDHETLDSYTFTVVADDGVNDPVEQVVSLSVNDLDEVAPSITSGATATAVDENSGANQVVYTATANDSQDTSAGVTFSLKPGVGDAAKFSIDATTSAVTLLEDPDHETRASYTFTVVADDGVNDPVEQVVTLDVNNVNDAPTGGVSIGVNNGHSTADLAQGDVLTAANTLADADGLGVVTYTWKAGETVLGTGASFSLTQSEVGKALSVTASYTDGYGATESVTSAATAAVGNVDDEAAGSLAVGGTVAEGNTLTASLSGVSDLDGATTTAYRWQQRAGAGTQADPFVWSDIAGATQASFSIPADQSLVGASIRVVATTTDVLGGTSEFIGNAPTVANVNDAPTGGVSIGVNNGHSTADLAQGDVLTAANTLADADGLGVITYTWKTGETVLGTGASFTLTQSEVGKALSVTASYTDGYGAPESVTSAATAAVANVDDEAAGSLAVSGTVAEGNTLTASLSGVSDLDGATTTAYRWQQRAGAGTQADPFVWSDVAGATQASFNIPADQSLVGASIRVVATTTDVLGGTSEFIGQDLMVETAPSSTTIEGLVYHWKTHALLSDAVATAGNGVATAASDAMGRYTLDVGPGDSVALNVSRPVGDGIANSGITSADALAALRIAVGLNPNPMVDGARAPISPYQIIAADVNNSGTVTSADALAILRMAVKLSTATPQQWLFVEETRDFWDEAAGQSTLTRSAASWDRSIQVDPTNQADVNLVGILKGDVNGSWAAPEGTPDLDITDPTYFQDLAALIGVPENYWG